MSRARLVFLFSRCAPEMAHRALAPRGSGNSRISGDSPSSGMHTLRVFPGTAPLHPAARARTPSEAECPALAS